MDARPKEFCIGESNMHAWAIAQTIKVDDSANDKVF
jgi:hypothetical protein